MDGDVPPLSLVLLDFLQHHQGGSSLAFSRALEDLDRHIQTCSSTTEEDAELQTDGHCPLVACKDAHLLLRPQLRRPVDPEDARAAREMAAELIRIAAQLELSVLSRAAEDLEVKLRSSPAQLWCGHLAGDVRRLLGRVRGHREIQQELLEMAISFTLMKMVCERAPHFLFGLYSTVVEYFKPSGR